MYGKVSTRKTFAYIGNSMSHRVVTTYLFRALVPLVVPYNEEKKIIIIPFVYRMSHLMFAPFLEGNPDNDSQSSSDRTVKNCLLQKGYEHTKNTLKRPSKWARIHPTLRLQFIRLQFLKSSLSYREKAKEPKLLISVRMPGCSCTALHSVLSYLTLIK